MAAEVTNTKESLFLEDLSLREAAGLHRDTEADGKPQVMMVTMTEDVMQSCLPTNFTQKQQRSGNHLLN